MTWHTVVCGSRQSQNQAWGQSTLLTEIVILKAINCLDRLSRAGMIEFTLTQGRLRNIAARGTRCCRPRWSSQRRIRMADTKRPEPVHLLRSITPWRTPPPSERALCTVPPNYYGGLHTAFSLYCSLIYTMKLSNIVQQTLV